MSRAATRVAVLTLLLITGGCTTRQPPMPPVTLTPLNFSDLVGWSEDQHSAALGAFLRSCAALAQLPDKTVLGIAGTAAAWRAVCAAPTAADTATDEAARHFFERWFLPYAVGDGAREGLFTGYFEPELRGARQPSARFATPLLRRPPDLDQRDPYPTRAEIERGALDRFHLPFLWVDDPVDAFILQIQGSGRVRLPDGSEVRVAYDGTNRRPYVAIGRLLVERGVLAREDISLPAIRAWLETHPAEGRALMDEDAAYVFFREAAGDGPVGTEGVVLTPGRSLAVDAQFIPLGAPLWLDIAQGGKRRQRLAVAQDTGTAIRGAVRGDLFWGFGAAAEARAGDMRARGTYAILLPRKL